MLRWILFQPSKLKRVSNIVSRDGRDVLEFTEVPKERTYAPSCYLHQFMRSDDDRHFHDHVGWSISLPLRTGYWEVTPALPLAVIRDHPDLVPHANWNWRWVPPGRIRIRRADEPHFIALDREPKPVVHHGHIVSNWTPLTYMRKPRPVMSLWIRGPWRRQWGFYTEAGWVPWDEYDARGEYRYTPKG